MRPSNKGMKQTKPAQAMELRSLSPVLGGLPEGIVELRSANLPVRYEELGRYPVRLTLPVYFRHSASPAIGGPWANGSGCLLRLGGKTLGITCRHVLEAYRRARDAEAGAVFLFGGVQLEPDRHLVAESTELDIVTLDLTPFIGSSLEVASCIHPLRWPPHDVTTDDILAFAGFPGVWREEVATNHLRFYSFSSGASPVHRVGTHHLYTRIEPGECVAALNDRLIIGSLGGLSGGPVFAWRLGPVAVAEFVGIISEYQDSYDLLYIRRAHCLQADGTLCV